MGRLVKACQACGLGYPPQTASFTNRGCGAKTSTSSRSSLECMPAELLKMVFDDEILEKQDITALGLCS